MTTPLKTGQIPTDRRLDRIPMFDERSKSYPIRSSRALHTLMPRSYTWHFDDPYVLDQGSEGACVGFGFANELRCRPVAVRHVDEVSARNIYWGAQILDEWPGGEYKGADPVYSGTSVLAGAKYLKNLAYYTEYRWAASEQELAWGVSHKGPAVIGVNWYEGMYDTDDQGLIKPEGDIIGGHCVLIRGYNVRTARYIGRNSWGPTWGVNGDFYINRNDMERLLREDGEACIPVRK